MKFQSTILTNYRTANLSNVISLVELCHTIVRSYAGATEEIKMVLALDEIEFSLTILFVSKIFCCRENL